MALTGTFEDVSFAELLQMLNVGHKTGRLRVWRGDEKAVLFMTAGEVARAISQRRNGPELVYRVLGWKTGEFCFEPTDEPVVREIQESTEALILEGMKRLDEWERLETELPNLQVVLRQRAFAVNERFDELGPQAQALLPLVDARRDVATIIRESGLETVEALTAVSELLDLGIVEQWSRTPQSGDVIATAGKLPDHGGEIQLQQSAGLPRNSQPAGHREAAVVQREHNKEQSGQAARTEE
jgi:hypothetical protein